MRVKAVLLCLVLVQGSAFGAAPAGGREIDFRSIIAEAKDRVFPAVVFVKCIRESHEEGKKKAQEIAGSGVLINTSGEILTNWHVVDKALEVRCLLYDGRSFDAEVIGTDKDLDLALLRLALPPEGDPVPFAELGDSSELNEGDFAIAMGAPWGLARSVTIGIISCVRRFLQDHSEYSLWLQTDAAISPGNSGGPLVNTKGEIIGINTLGALIGGDMGFAVPSDVIREILPRFRKRGQVEWSWLGLELQPLRDFNRNMYFEGTEGVIVAGTAEGSPARHAGVRDRDRLLAIGDTQVTALTDEDLPAIRRLIGMLPMEEAVTLALLRDRETLTVDVVPSQKGKVEGEEFDCPRWDLTVKAINRFDNPDLYFYRRKGVFVFGIESPGNAANANLRHKDILVESDGTEVETLDDVEEIYEKALDGIDARPRVRLTILRGGLMRQVILDFSRDYERE